MFSARELVLGPRVPNMLFNFGPKFQGLARLCGVSINFRACVKGVDKSRDDAVNFFLNSFSLVLPPLPHSRDFLFFVFLLTTSEY